MTEKDKKDLLEFAQDHIDFFGAIPLEFETESGDIIPYIEIWQVCEENGLTKQLL